MREMGAAVGGEPSVRSHHGPQAARFHGVKSASTSADCALLFFGLAKQFQLVVLPSITRHILSRNPGCDIYAHTYNVSETSNARNGEARVAIAPSEVFALTRRVVMDSEAAFLHARNLTWFRQYFPWKEKDIKPLGGWLYPTSMDNMIKQWHSIERVWYLMARSGVRYARVGLFRLDVQYVTDIDVHDGGDAVVPQFASLPQIDHINDRMVYGTFASAKIWATGRFSHAEKYVASHPHIHSETFLSDLLATNNVHPVLHPAICFCRVRATGKISVDDCDDTPGWHIWHRKPTVCSLPTAFGRR